MIEDSPGGPLTDEIRELERAFVNEENIVDASCDPRMARIVKAVALTAQGYSISYKVVGKVLDKLESDYGLEPIEIVEAYNLCEDRESLMLAATLEENYEV